MEDKDGVGLNKLQLTIKIPISLGFKHVLFSECPNQTRPVHEYLPAAFPGIMGFITREINKEINEETLEEDVNGRNYYDDYQKKRQTKPLPIEIESQQSNDSELCSSAQLQLKGFSNIDKSPGNRAQKQPNNLHMAHSKSLPTQYVFRNATIDTRNSRDAPILASTKITNCNNNTTKR
ncbi:hypothetical protein G4B88_030416 [Cannabis sativa]|uniref:Uncharacterized protein n=1 Tax=Cannabis sativa TaxID=3483 RepID=A0A7J6F6L8_CANSA|nr:hypothetical protein G4B88_030416 [Cannabis sativa]